MTGKDDSVGVIWPEVWDIYRCQIHGWYGDRWPDVRASVPCPDCCQELEQMGEEWADQEAEEEAAGRRRQFRVVRPS